MQVDKTTILDIGLLDNYESKGLASHLDFCKTNGGKVHWMQLITAPLASKYAIESRQAALQIFISEKAFLDQMKISNGTCLVIDQFYGTGFSQIPKHISLTGAYWYQFWNKTDYALIAYSVHHLLNFVQALDQWLKVFEPYSNNTELNALIAPIKKHITQLDCLRVDSKDLKKEIQIGNLLNKYINILKYTDDNNKTNICVYYLYGLCKNGNNCKYAHGINDIKLKKCPDKYKITNLDIIKKYYTVTDDPTKADFAMVFIKSPVSNGYSRADREAGGNGYMPISLQLKDYTAVDAREHSIAAGDPVIDPTITNRSYKGKTSKSNSYPDLNTILETKKAMNGKPVIVSVAITNPMVFGEFEKEVDAIVGEFGVQIEALLDIVSGKTEPSGLLPLQMPIDMTTVEKQFEDVPHDMIPYRDSNGNVYDFGFGLNWKGTIKDARTEKYSVKK